MPLVRLHADTSSPTIRSRTKGTSALRAAFARRCRSILFCDLDVAQLLELGERKPAATLPQRHKSQIRYSDKKRVARFRTYATDLYEKQSISDKAHDLIGDLTLDGTLTELGRVAREADAAAGLGACHWRPNSQADVSTFRSKIDEAMRLLGDFATRADVGFQSTHGKSQRHRDPGSSRSRKQFGMGWPQQAVDTARRIVTIRCMTKDIYDGNWQQCFARAAALESEGVLSGVINPATPRPELLAHLVRVRRQFRKNLQGKRRMQMVDDSGTSSTKSLKQRKRAATKREVDAIMERPCRTRLSRLSPWGRTWTWRSCRNQHRLHKSVVTTARVASGQWSRNGFVHTTWRKATKFTP